MMLDETLSKLLAVEGTPKEQMAAYLPFGRMLLKNGEFRGWLAGMAGRGPGERVSVRANLASHLGYVFDFGNAKINVKFYGIQMGSCKDYDPVFAMNQEYGTLKELHGNGFRNGSCRVVAPLGINPGFYAALATEFVGDDSLLKMLRDVAMGGREERKLEESLAKTASALVKIHGEMPNSGELDMEHEISRLREETLLGIRSRSLRRRIDSSLNALMDNDDIASFGSATIHGDANPTNFILNGGFLYVLDFERLERDRSPLVDLGTMIADINYNFVSRGRRVEDAGKYIGHFLGSYAGAHAGLEECVRPFVGCGMINITKFIGEKNESCNWLRSEALGYLE